MNTLPINTMWEKILNVNTLCTYISTPKYFSSFFSKLTFINVNNSFTSTLFNSYLRELNPSKCEYFLATFMSLNVSRLSETLLFASTIALCANMVYLAILRDGLYTFMPTFLTRSNRLSSSPPTCKKDSKIRSFYENRMP